jgi:hypothetical protein
MQADETTMFGSFWLNTIKRDLAVVVTAVHVLVLRIDSVDGQPRWIALAAWACDVKVYLTNTGFGIQPGGLWHRSRAGLPPCLDDRFASSGGEGEIRTREGALHPLPA